MNLKSQTGGKLVLLEATTVVADLVVVVVVAVCDLSPSGNWPIESNLDDLPPVGSEAVDA